MVDTDTIACPTLIMMRTMARLRLGDRAAAAFDHASQSVRLMHRAGVKIIAGTDANETPFAPVPHGSSWHQEMALLRQIGMTTTDVLTAATSQAASGLRLHDRGSLKRGRRADLLLLRTDPTKDPAAISRPVAIWCGGTQIDCRPTGSPAASEDQADDADSGTD